jgi:hypothetical protein
MEETMKHLIRTATLIAAALALTASIAPAGLASGEQKNMPPFAAPQLPVHALRTALGEAKNQWPFTRLTLSDAERAAAEAAGSDVISRYLISHAATAGGLPPAQVAHLGAQTEAAGFDAISRYLVSHALTPAQVAHLGAQTEAEGYLTLVREHQQLAVTPTTSGHSAIAWGDVRTAAALSTVVLLFAAAGAWTLRRREVATQLR